jgi:hypothetical protein
MSHDYETPIAAASIADDNEDPTQHWSAVAYRRSVTLVWRMPDAWEQSDGTVALRSGPVVAEIVPHADGMLPREGDDRREAQRERLGMSRSQWDRLRDALYRDLEQRQRPGQP